MLDHLRFVARSVVALSTLGLTCAIGAPASATVSVGILVAPATGIPTASRYNVVAQCNPSAGVATSLNQVTFAIVGTAEAYASDGTPAWSTSVYCVLKDGVTGAEYGRTPHRAFPGPFAVSEGLIAVPLRSDPILCGYASAMFADGAIAYGKTSDPRC